MMLVHRGTISKRSIDLVINIQELYSSYPSQEITLKTWLPTLPISIMSI